MSGGGIASRPGQLHEGLRRLRRRRQVGRQDPPRGQDGHPRRRPPGRPRLHRLEAATRRRRPGRSSRPGYDPSFTGEAYGSVFFQNANHSRPRHRRRSCRRSRRTATGRPTRSSTARRSAPTRPATSSGAMAEAAYVCGDPGIQYDTTINDWHTSANTDRIYASNPCSEYMFLNDTACNLASLNLMKFVDDGRRVRRRGVSLRRQGHDHRPGDPRRQRAATRRRRSRRTATASGRSAWATPTSARC